MTDRVGQLYVLGTEAFLVIKNDLDDAAWKRIGAAGMSWYALYGRHDDEGTASVSWYSESELRDYFRRVG